MPRKSSGCLCCRRRKIKCDEGKPACRRCIDFRIECPGYERKPTQLQYRFKDQTYRVVSRASSEQRAVSLPGSDEHFQETVKPKREIQGPVLILPGPYDISSPILWQTQIYSAFLDVYLPRDACRKTTNPHGYIVAISNARGNHPALNAAMIAVSTGQLGAMYDDEVLLSTSLRAYGMALTQLNSSLACYGSASQDETLATITALALCEFFPHLGGNGRGWESHVTGAREYLELRGPSSIQFGSELGRSLFDNARHASTVQGLVTRNALCFEKPEWLEVTRERSKTGIYTALMDLSVQVPGLLQRVDEFIALDPSSLEATELVQKLGNICSRLQQLSKRFQTQGVPGYEIVPISALDNLPDYVKDGAPEEKAYRFERFLCGHGFLLFNLLMSIITSQCLVVMELSNERSSRPLSSPFPSELHHLTKRTMLQHSQQALRCLPYMCRAQTGSVGRIGLLMVACHLGNILPELGLSSELAWVNKLVEFSSPCVNIPPPCINTPHLDLENLG